MNIIPFNNLASSVKKEQIHFSLASVPEHASVILAMLQSCATYFNWSPDFSERIFQAGTEGFINGMEHGNGYNPQKQVCFALTHSESGVEIVIQDQGNGFNPDALPDPLAPENILKASGRGLFLIRHWADEVHFEDNGKRLVLNFYAENEDVA
ncbi:MAG: ATP-binding protein [Rhodothermia bacterium]|nr:ATP-binding protein [Rhodothermia bacterium]